MNRAKALQIDSRDNVAVALCDVKAGDRIGVMTEKRTIEIVAQADICFGHKVALINLQPHQPIIKYGEEIGKSSDTIPAGDWVHLHNVYCERGKQ